MYLLLAAAVGLSAMMASDETASALQAAKEQERVSRLLLEAARSGEFYLVADVGSKRLTLGLAGITLASYGIESVEVGTPLIQRTGSPDETDLLQDLYACEAPVLRERTEILPGQPPLPEHPSANDAPAEESHRRVVLDCEPSLAVHLVEGSVLGRFGGLRDRVRLAGDRKVDLRVRVFLRDGDADELFASLPDSPLLLFSRVPTSPPTAISTERR
ncbi:MAG TPA: hypothetical protein VLK65_10595 [Vicinamibacteria bacterium]|nr:hypothetical protein [Vicinamibacteria bacterium]